MNKKLANYFRNFYRPMLNNLNNDTFYEESKEILDYLKESTLNNDKHFKSTCNSRTMQRLVNEVLQGNDIFFESIIESSDARHNNDICICFIEIASEFFIDARINWGRVVTIYALSVSIVKFLKQNNRTNEIDDLMNAILMYILNKLGEWIKDNGGWVRKF
jgi:hypothetical protein